MTVRPKSSPRQVESAEDLCISRADASSVSPCHTCRWRHRRAGRLFSCTVALKPETTVAYLDGELDMSTAVSHDPFGPLAKTGGREAMAVTTFEDLPLADRSHHWDGDEADKRVREWA